MILLLSWYIHSMFVLLKDFLLKISNNQRKKHRFHTFVQSILAPELLLSGKINWKLYSLWELQLNIYAILQKFYDFMSPHAQVWMIIDHFITCNCRVLNSTLLLLLDSSIVTWSFEIDDLFLDQRSGSHIDCSVHMSGHFLYFLLNSICFSSINNKDIHRKYETHTWLWNICKTI